MAIRSTHALPAQPAIRARQLPVAGWLTVLLLAILGLLALFGGWQLVTAPDGSKMQMPLEWLRYSPFADYFWPGLMLFAVFGIGSLIGVALAVARVAVGPYWAFAIGVGQMIWIVTELVMSRLLHPVLHPTLFATGALIAILASLWWSAWRARGLA